MDFPQVPAAPGAGGAPPPALPRRTERALAVAADANRRKILVLWLRERGYLVRGCSNPVEATTMLRGSGGGFSLVVLDAFPPCVGSLELLRCAIGEMRLHVLGTSKAGSFYGPLDMDDLRIISPSSQKVIKSKLAEAMLHGQNNGSASTTTTVSSSGRRATRKTKRQLSHTESQEVEQDGEYGDAAQGERSKKARLVWTDELHNKFIDAYNKLLPRDIVPKKILKLMNDDTLTRENIASHLQKYRLTLKQPEQHTLWYQRVAPPQAQDKDPRISWEFEYFNNI